MAAPYFFLLSPVEAQGGNDMYKVISKPSNIETNYTNLFKSET